MKISLDWIADFVNIEDIPTSKLISVLTMKSVEVEEFYDASTLLDKIVVGEILEIAPHPNADRLKIVRVNVGYALKNFGISTEERVDVVCGGTNLILNTKVALALPGAKVKWHGQAEYTVLEPATIRGVKSFGMICASEELGWMKGSVGEILILSQHSEVGQPLAQTLGISRGIMEVKVLSNRPDLFSHNGLAREIAALFDRPFQEKSYKFPVETRKQLPFLFEKKSKAICPRYSALLISGIHVADSPDWLKNRLRALGLRPINNIVDLTNYLMLDTGQPLHAFDYDRLNGHMIVLDTAVAGEEIETLDRKKRGLKAGMLVIRDEQAIIDLAGIMGGELSSVTPRTKNILLQAAIFDPSRIRRTSRELGLRTEAVVRYEKGVNQQTTLNVLAKAWQMLLDMDQDIQLEQVVDDFEKASEQQMISFPVSSISRLAGIELPKSDILAAFERLSFTVMQKTPARWQVTPPSWRKDVVGVSDLVEEALRLTGYDQLRCEMPVVGLKIFEPNMAVVAEQILKRFWQQAGFHEVLNFSMVPRQWADQLGHNGVARLLLQNPLSDDKSVMRSELVSSILSNIERNMKQTPEIRLFEYAPVYYLVEQIPQESWHLTALATGNTFDFLSMKGIVERLAARLFEGEHEVSCEMPMVDSNPLFDSFMTVGIVLDQKIIGSFGRISAQACQFFGIAGDVFYCDLDVEQVIINMPKSSSFTPLPQYPSIRLDLAIVVDMPIPWEQVRTLILGVCGAFLREIELFDLYKGARVLDGKKSFAFHLEFRSDERTLTMEEVRPVFETIQRVLREQLGALIRKA